MSDYLGLFGTDENDAITYKSFLNLRSWKQFDFENKEKLFRYHLYSKVRKTAQMFKWKGLPDTIPNRILEMRIQMRGYAILHHYDGKTSEYPEGYYISYGTLGSIPDYNYMPSKAIVNNPYLKFSKELHIGKDCVVIPNDTMYLGMIPLMNYYSSQDTETDISMNLLKINARLMALITAGDDDSYEDAKELFNDLKKGKQRVILDKNFMSKNVTAQPLSSQSNTQTIIQLLEEKQYNKGSFWNEVGVQSNYNMKRETITSNENILNVDSILPFADDMIDMRKNACESIKKIFGLDWSVEFSSAWKKLRTEIELKEKEINDDKDIKSNQLDKKDNGENKDENKDE